MSRSTIFAAFIAAATVFGAMDARAHSDVTVSIKPVHSLVAGVMRGVAEPYLLIPGSASPHNYSLKPSDAQALERARVVFWIGEDMETFLEKPLEALAHEARIVALAEAPGVELRAIREGGKWQAHDHGHGEEHAHEDDHSHNHGEHADAKGHDHALGAHDMHLWLDTENAKAMVKHIATVLSDADPANAETYARNGADMTARLDDLTAELRGTLAPVADKPFLVFHDAYQYFEARFGLNSVGAITVSPEAQPGAQRVREIQQRIQSLSAACAFSEPQFPPKLIEVVTEGTDARAGVLDPLGADIAEGPDHYFDLMRQNARALVSCLSAEG